MPTEVRSTDWNSWTVNGLTAHKHITTMDSALEYAAAISSGAIRTIYCAIRAWKRASDGTETEIGDAGTYKAEAHGTPLLNSKRTISGQWTYPDVALVSTDCLRVNFYMRLIDNSFSEADLVYTVVTEQLGAQSLDTNTLTAIYIIDYTTPFYIEETWFGWYEVYGEYFMNSNIEYWKWTPYVPPVVAQMVGDGLSFAVG